MNRSLILNLYRYFLIVSQIAKPLSMKVILIYLMNGMDRIFSFYWLA
jgi:hypothetical protein